MIVGIYDPYFHILGGAERYVLSIALCFPRDEVIIFTKDGELLTKAQKKFNLELPHVKTELWSDDRGERNRRLKQLDILFYVTDGSLFFSPAPKNILIIQSPVHIPQPSLKTYIKLTRWQTLLCYSEFVVQFVQKKLHKTPVTLFVPVELPKLQTLKKENLIVSVGRFFTQLHNKKQLEMVSLFKKIYKNGPPDLKLVLIGSVDPGGEEYFAQVKKESGGFPIEIITNATYEDLKKYYQRAKIYWHAAGFGENLEKHPEKAEHFGVSTVEAMSYGVVPVVFGAGGQTEIVINGENGFIWRTEQELKKYTIELLQNEPLRQRIVHAALRSSQGYSHDKFCQRLYEILEK